MSELPKGWKETTLGDVGLLARGKSKHRPRWAPHLYDGEYPFIQTGQVKSAPKYIFDYEQTYSEAGLAQSKLWEKDTLCVTIAANIAEIAILKFPACFPDSVLGFRPDKEKCDLDFVYYYFSIVQARLRQIAIGSVQDNINLGTFERFPFFFPPLPEQRAIAGILSSLDDKIEVLREQNKTLETLAQTLFKEWFVDNTDGNLVEISELIEFNPIEKVERSKEYLFFDMKTLPVNSISTSEGVYKQSNSGTSFREGDTLFAKITPCLENGKTAFVFDLKGESIARGSTEFIVMRAKESGSPYLNYCLCRNSKFRDYAIQSMIGSSGRQRVPVDRLKTYTLHHSNEQVVKFDNALKPMFEKIKSNALQIQTLSKTRDTLLPKLMSGAVRVEEFTA